MTSQQSGKNFATVSEKAPAQAGAFSVAAFGDAQRIITTE